MEAKPCPDCGAQTGESHYPGCDVERCANCGHQAISCDCDPDDPLRATGPRMPWSGELPGDAECREYGIGLNELVMTCRWDRARQRWVKPGAPTMTGPADDEPRTLESVEAALDQATANELRLMVKVAKLEREIQGFRFAFRKLDEARVIDNGHAEEVERLKALLRELEWKGWVPYLSGSPGCPSCHKMTHEGHDPDCRLKAAIG